MSVSLQTAEGENVEAEPTGVEDSEAVEEEEPEPEAEPFISIFSILDAPRELPEPVVLTREHLKQIQDELGIITLCWPEITDPQFDGFEYYPPGYVRNSDKEKLLLLYTENFRRQFIKKWPNRKPLLLAADSELGLKKMVCTTLRLTTLPYPDIDTFEKCADFVGDHITYEALETPTLIPNRIYSPYTVFSRQTGNSYEIATALCSLLLGLNYNAFVVSGYATRDVALKIMMRVNVPFPPIVDEEEVEEEQKAQTKYQMKPPNDLRSKFLLAMAQREIDKVLEAKRLEEEEERKRTEEEERPPFDELYGLRVHAWVLLLTANDGEREILEPIFIEPSTGYRHPLSSNLYCGIESIWNNVNYWINLQDCKFGLGELSYDLQDLSKWEHLLPGEPLQFRDMVFDDSLEEEEIKQLKIQDEKHLDMPAPWSLKIHIPIDRIKMKFPDGIKKTWYKRCLVEQFSEFVQEDGLVTRVCRYTDMDCSPSELKVIEEHYANRVDKLEKIKSDCLTGLIIEYFASGREDSIKKHSYYTGHTSLESVRVIEYYHKCRYDGLAKTELDPVFIIEHFINREDKLYYRHIAFAKRGDPPPGMIEGPRRITIRIVEKYHRNPTKKATEDIESRDFDIIEREIHLKYHYDSGRVTASTRDYFKPPLAEMGDTFRFTPQLTVGYQADIGAKPPRMLNLFLLFETQLDEEERALHRVREKEDEILDFIQKRALETANPELSVSLFDQKHNEEHRLAMLQKEQEEREHREHEVEEETDYLGPYLAKLGNPENLTLEQATAVYNMCLTDFKQMLIDRANDIQSQFELMSHLIQEEQTKFLANQDDLTAEEERQYFETVNECTFYLHTLELRLARHRDLSPLRYENIVNYLTYDPRLQILYNRSSNN